MIGLEAKIFNIIITEKQQKYWHYHQAKLIKYEYLTGKEILPFNQSQMIEQAKIAYSLLVKAFEKQTYN